MKNAFLFACIMLLFFRTSAQQKVISYTSKDYNTIVYPFLAKTKASFGLHFSTAMHNNSNVYSPLVFRGNFNDGNHAVRGGNVSLGDVNIRPDAYDQYNSVIPDLKLIGKIQLFSLEKKTTTAGEKPTIIRDSLYVPVIISIIDPIPSMNLNENFISKRMRFSWHPDPKNPSGEITIIIQYYPNGLQNRHQQKKGKKVENAVSVPDNGSIELPEKLFSGIAKGSAVTLTFQRFSYKENIDRDGESYLIYAYSMKYSDYTYR